MAHSLRLKGFFLGCVIGMALVTRLAFAASIGLLGPLSGLAGIANELCVIVALFAASRLTERLNCYYDNRARRRVLEQGFLKWMAELEAKKSAVATEPTSVLKKAA